MEPYGGEDFVAWKSSYEVRVRVYKSSAQVVLLSWPERTPVLDKKANHRWQQDVKKYLKSSLSRFSLRPHKTQNFKKTSSFSTHTNSTPLFSFEEHKTDMLSRMEQMRRRMVQGDCYLSNMTFCVSTSASFPTPLQFLYTWFAKKTPYGIYIFDACKKVGLCSFSPERFVHHKHGMLLASPIKGTLSVTAGISVWQSAKDLWACAKEMYEHTLVVDLLRHDLNGVCLPGSVHVKEAFCVRLSASLLQMYSNIEGTLPRGALGETASSLLPHLLPAGSISGAPKKNVCTFIEELELGPRGFYTGIFGICEPDGEWDTVVLIRSVYLGKRGVYVGVGAGMTTLSDPAREWDECCLKLKSFEDVFCAPTRRSL